MSRKIIVAVMFFLLSVSDVPSFAADAGKIGKFCVVDEMLPVMREAGAPYEIDDGYVIDGRAMLGLVVYGNHIETREIEGEYAGTWVELMDPEERGASLGFIEKKGLEPLPEYNAFGGRKFFARVDAPDLTLQPGVLDEKHKLSRWAFSLVRGEVVTAFGSAVLGGDEWLLLGFSSLYDYEGGGDGGVGMRYAWALSSDLTRLDGYEPDYSRNEEALVPAMLRRSPPFYSHVDSMYRSGLEAIPASARARLVDVGFHIEREPQIPDVVVVDDMADLYSSTSDYEVDFLTADMFMHAYHLIFSRMLQKLEEEYFSPTLKGSMTAALSALEKASLPDGLEKSRATALDMLSIPIFLLSGDKQANISDRGRAEAGRILSADARELSPVTGVLTDYTQYRPRGHYAGNPTLEDYFRAMSFLGNAGLPLFDEASPNLENVATASLLVLALDAAGEQWRSFDGPIDFLVGTSDDGSFAVYRHAVLRHVASIADSKKLADEEVLTDIAADIRRSVANPRIRDRETGIISKEDEEATRTPEFRISGKRFTFDAYAMNQLTSPRVGNDEEPRNLPEGTDVMFLLGSKAAGSVAADNLGIENYEESLKRLASEVMPSLEGTDTAYSRWLRAIAAFFRDSGSRQVFYRSVPWAFKKLVTASASWAELKHDTVLYAKQGGAEMGGGGDWYAAPFAPPLPRGYVEPDPQAFEAIISALYRLTYFFEAFRFEGAEGEYTRKIAEFREMCETARSIAERQVRDEMLIDEDYSDIKRLARSLSWELLMPSEGGNYAGEWEKLRMAIVTDVATDFVDGVALHVATGVPRKMLVFVNDRSGGPRVARGYVYSYYEFPRSLGDGRMTDAEWREIVYDPERVEELNKFHPDWYWRIYGK